MNVTLGLRFVLVPFFFQVGFEVTALVSLKSRLHTSHCPTSDGQVNDRGKRTLLDAYLTSVMKRYA